MVGATYCPIMFGNPGQKKNPVKKNYVWNFNQAQLPLASFLVR